jgi:hypothetical protein
LQQLLPLSEGAASQRHVFVYGKAHQLDTVDGADVLEASFNGADLVVPIPCSASRHFECIEGPAARLRLPKRMPSFGTGR